MTPTEAVPAGRPGLALERSAPHFVPELALGIDAFDDELRTRLVGYLGRVLRARGFPLHVNVAWNALHFGYDPDLGYSSDLLDSGTPHLELGGRAPALPLGAIIWVVVGGKFHQAWAEVVGKDGRPPGPEPDGSAPADLAGRPAVAAPVARADEDDPGAPLDEAVLEEALVCDFDAFGPVEGLDKVLARLQRKGRLTAHQLVRSQAVYRPAEAADDSDTAFYARWLFEHRRHMLRSGPLGACLTDDSDTALRSALVASLATVDVLLSMVPGVVRWGDYALASEWVEEVDMAPDLPLHRADLESLITSLASGPGVRTTVLLPALERLAKAQPDPSRPDAVAFDPLAGTSYLTVVCRTNRWLADAVDDRWGVVHTRDGPRLARVDDRWPCGGLWRSEPYGPGHPLAPVPADEPLLLGSRGYSALAEFLGEPLAEVEAAIATALAPALAEKVEEGQSGEDARGEELGPEGGPDKPGPVGEPGPEPEATLVSATVTLRQVDLDQGTLLLPEELTWLGTRESVTVKLSHTGEADEDLLDQVATPFPGRPRLLEGLSWPLDFFAGIRLHLAALVSGTGLFVATTALEEPIEVEGKPIGFAFDPAVLRRECPSAEPSLADILTSALIRHGRLATDDTRRASAREVLWACFGRDSPPQLLLSVHACLGSLVASGRLGLVGSEYTWSPGAARPRRREIVPTNWGPSAPLVKAQVRTHWVPPFLRLLPWGYHASEAARERYQEARGRGEMWGPAELPWGYTYVTGHERGRGLGAYTEALRLAVSDVDGTAPGHQEVEQMARDWEDEP